jgi:predicted GIY-YIG superfamily endonuclease
LKATLPAGTRSQALRAEMAIKKLPREKKIEAVQSPALIKIIRRRKVKAATP